MIRKNGEYRIDIREKMMGGNGCFVVENILARSRM